jgi:tRNA dimethylallyltransferase
MDRKPKIILLAGPTALGKSRIAISLSKSLNGEIVNADSMQVYKELRILTSRPSLSDEKKIKHHLYGITSVRNYFSTGRWLKLATKEIKKILKKNKTPIIVGGTGLYYKALLDGLVKIPNIPIIVRNKIRQDHEKIGQVKFYNKLLKLDSKVKYFISPNDIQRSLRAYEVKKYTNKSLYEWIKYTKPNFDQNLFKKIFLNPPRDYLINKINSRIEKMFKQGVKKEVDKFFKLKVKKDMSANKIIGIPEIANYLNNSLSLQAAKELIRIRTRQYAKRQFTWARGKMTSWEMINPKNYKEILKKVTN